MSGVAQDRLLGSLDCLSGEANEVTEMTPSECTGGLCSPSTTRMISYGNSTHDRPLVSQARPLELWGGSEGVLWRL